MKIPLDTHYRLLYTETKQGKIMKNLIIATTLLTLSTPIFADNKSDICETIKYIAESSVQLRDGGMTKEKYLTLLLPAKNNISDDEKKVQEFTRVIVDGAYASSLSADTYSSVVYESCMNSE
jgi:hypothetical protein